MANDVDEIRECILAVVDAKTAEKVLQAILDRFKGSSAYFKKGWRSTPNNQDRDNQIKAMHQSGKSTREICNKFDLTDSRVWQIIRN